MASDRWRQVGELYQSALKLGAAERSALLAGADPELQADSTATQIAVGFQLGAYRIGAPMPPAPMGARIS